MRFVLLLVLSLATESLGRCFCYTPKSYLQFQQPQQQVQQPPQQIIIREIIQTTTPVAPITQIFTAPEAKVTVVETIKEHEVVTPPAPIINISVPESKPEPAPVVAPATQIHTTEKQTIIEKMIEQAPKKLEDKIKESAKKQVKKRAMEVLGRSYIPAIMAALAIGGVSYLLGKGHEKPPIIIQQPVPGPIPPAEGASSGRVPDPAGAAAANGVGIHAAPVVQPNPGQNGAQNEAKNDQNEEKKAGRRAGAAYYGSSSDDDIPPAPDEGPAQKPEDGSGIDIDAANAQLKAEHDARLRAEADAENLRRMRVDETLNAELNNQTASQPVRYPEMPQGRPKARKEREVDGDNSDRKHSGQTG